MKPQKLPKWVLILGVIILVFLGLVGVVDFITGGSQCWQQVKNYSPEYRKDIDKLLEQLKLDESFEAKREYEEVHCANPSEFQELEGISVSVLYGTNLDTESDARNEFGAELGKLGWMPDPDLPGYYKKQINDKEYYSATLYIWDQIGTRLDNFQELKNTGKVKTIENENSKLMDYNHVFHVLITHELR